MSTGQLVSVEALEQALTAAPPPCATQPNHDVPAAWRVNWEPCCSKAPSFSLFCTPCLDEIGKLKGLQCNYCGHCWFPGARAILSGHPI